MEDKYFEKVQSVYESLIDKKSKNTFKYRFLYNLTDDPIHLINMISENSSYSGYGLTKYYEDYLIAEQKGKKHKKLIIYGAYNSGILRYNFNKYLGLDDIFCFCDRDVQKQNTGLFGKDVISPEVLVNNHKDAMILIETKYFYDEVYDLLIKSGFPKENIINHVNFGKQYFDKNIIELSNSEVFVDCGCYNGDTIADFIEECNGKFEKIYAFDADESNYLSCCNFVKDNHLDNIEMINKGVWDKSEQLRFESGKEGYSCIIDENNKLDNIDTVNKEIWNISTQLYSEDKKETCPDIKDIEIINTISLDEYIGNNRVTFIKMDIEGAELKALKGAQNIIKRERPKLAICIYHKKEDILDISIYLKGLVPDYKFAIRHYTDREVETVLYAI